ncbi:MAG: U32 family peptidase [Firmicutes bacterium]|nr:U32 family peptidase [Bacillota bacterium]
MKKVELLAPVGSLASLYAAINAGCDAVYLSGYMFGARQFAPNFSDEEIVEAIKTCHIYGVKVYITVNTLIKDSEVETLLEYVEFLHKNNVDAVIMQDLGMIDLVRKTFPQLEIHASTQLHIHNLEGVKLCEKLGIKRVVLARETDINTVKNIKSNTNVELEVFVHGALCVSYSGQCLMSSLIGGRSGNRGSCAGTCRLPYTLLNKEGKRINKEDYILSMKDLYTLEHIDELIESGIESFKIEGRMKRPEYVYLVVSLYRKAIDSYYETGHVIIDENYLDDLKKIFNRKFTKGFLFNEHNNNITNSYRPNHLGVEVGKIVDFNNKSITIKLLDDLRVGDGIRIIGDDFGFMVTSIYKNKNRVDCASKSDIVTIFMPEKGCKVSISKNNLIVKTTDSKQIEELKSQVNSINKKIILEGTIVLTKGKPLCLELSDGLNCVRVEGEMVEEAKNAPLDISQIEKQIKKLGSTPFVLGKLSVEKDEKIYINNKYINDLRRKATDELAALRNYKTDFVKGKYTISVPSFERKQETNILLEDSKFYSKIKDLNLNYIYTDDYNLFSNNDSRLILKLPRVMHKFEEYNKPLLVGEVGSLQLCNKVAGDFSLNAFNSYTVAFLHSIGVEKILLSYELSIEDIKELIMAYEKRYTKMPNVEVLIYGREEMMISKFSLNKLYRGDNLYLCDRFNNSYPVREKDDLMYIYNHKPRVWDLAIKDYYDLGVNAVRINIFDNKDLEWVLSKIES